MLSLEEVQYTEIAARELRSVGWAAQLVQRFEQNGGPALENMPLMFEVRFAFELHRRGFEPQYEYPAGIGDTTADFGIVGPQEWLIELVSVRESKGLQAATTKHDFYWTRELHSDSPDPRQSEEAEMIVALGKIAEKVYSDGRPTKFPQPTLAFHAIVVDMRGYLGSGGDEYDYTQIANGAAAIPDSEWPARRFWQDSSIRGLFERTENHPLKGALSAQERLHFVGFVAERQYRAGEIEENTHFRPNPYLLRTSDRQLAAYQTFPLARAVSAA